MREIIFFCLTELTLFLLSSLWLVQAMGMVCRKLDQEHSYVFIILSVGVRSGE
jgi:hypothetical protein